MNQKQIQALFAPGDITCTSAAFEAMREAGTTGLSLIYQHITGHWGTIDEEQRAANQAAIGSQGLHDTVVSRYGFAGDLEIVVTTMFVDTPSLRWTDICLPDEVIPDADADDMGPMAEAAFVMAELSEADDLPAGEAPGPEAETPAETEPITEGEVLMPNTIILDDPSPAPTTRSLEEGITSLAQLKPGPFQNRQTFDRLKMAGLAQSIQTEGLIHPPIVCLIEGEYRLLAGERRWRALCALALAGAQAMSLDNALDLVCQTDWPTQLDQYAGILAAHPLPVRLDVSADPERRHHLSVIDNFQHAGLNPIEEARDFQSLKTAYGYSDRQVARVVGASEAHIKSRLRLLELDDPIQALVAQGQLPRDRRVADALLAIPEPEARLKMAHYHAQRKSAIKVIVGACQRLVAELAAAPPAQAEPDSPEDPPMIALALQGQDRLTQKRSEPPDSFRQAVKAMCHQCTIGRQHLPEIPEPAWAIVTAEATYICDHCELRRVQQACRHCPGLALVRGLANRYFENEREGTP